MLKKRLLPISQTLITLLSLNVITQAANFYVATNGDDGNTGADVKAPFATVQHALKQMNPGDHCYMRKGIYHEQINLAGIAGAAGKPITLSAYDGEKVVIDGTIKLTGDWEKDQGSIYKSKVTQDITQLFVDGKMMTLARFPNAKVFSEEMWHRTAVRCQKTPESNNGHVISGKAPAKDISQLGVSLDGCVALLNFGAHSTSARIVKNHKRGTSEFDYSPELLKYKTTINFFFEGGVGNADRKLLDSEEEWSYDETTKTLYLWTDDGKAPTGREIKGKVQTYAITGDANTKHIVVDGIDFFATTFSFQHSDYITIRNCDFSYYASSKRSLGIGGFSDTAEFIGSEEDFCSFITLYNCAFRYSDASGLKGEFVENMLIENNLFYNIDYAGVNNDLGKKQPFSPCSSIRLNKIQDVVYRRNTLHTSGNAQGFSANRYIKKNPGKGFRPNQYKPDEIRNIVCEYNFHTMCGLQHTDGASLYIPEAHVMESVARYNWFIANGQRDFRWDGNNKPLNGVHANLYRNVALDGYNKRMSPSGGNGFRIKGSYHEVYNNLGVGRGGELNIATEKGKNEKTVTRNNAATVLTDYPLPGDASHNFGQSRKSPTLHSMLRDPTNWDFRPKANATSLIDQGIPVKCSIKGNLVDVTKGFLGKAPDIGVYEFGAKTYWIPGRMEAQASMPIPKNEAQNVPLDADLMYLTGLGGVKVDVYFGKKPDSLKRIRTLIHPRNIASLPSEHKLQQASTYFWRVDTHRKDGSMIKGKVWSFTTTDGMEPESGPAPKKGKRRAKDLLRKKHPQMRMLNKSLWLVG